MNQKAACEIPLFSRLTNTGLKKTPTTTKYQSLKNDDKKKPSENNLSSKQYCGFPQLAFVCKGYKKKTTIKTIEKYTQSYTDQY